MSHLFVGTDGIMMKATTMDAIKLYVGGSAQAGVNFENAIKHNVKCLSMQHAHMISFLPLLFFFVFLPPKFAPKVENFVLLMLFNLFSPVHVTTCTTHCF